MPTDAVAVREAREENPAAERAPSRTRADAGAPGGELPAEAPARHAFLRRILEEPGYRWERDGKFYRPTGAEIFAEWKQRVNLFASAKNWLPFTNWFWTLALMPFAVVFLAKYLSWKLCLVGFVYSMVWLGTHGTIWFHRYATHRAYTFRNPVYRFICRNLSIKIVPDEIYVISHHVHHAFSERAGDPYNTHGGWWYVFLAGELHQPIARNLSREDYERLKKLMNHTGVILNSYEQYQTWGSLCHPFYLYAHFALNWAFWYGAFYLLGGHALACAIFGFSSVWAVGIRTFNWDGHGGGKDKRRAGVDFYDKDYSINQLWPGMVAGEWHNNHHLFPNGVRSGFLWYQFDTAWQFIRLYRLLGGVTSWRDYKDRFHAKYYQPWLAAQGGRTVAAAAPVDEAADARS